MNKVVSIFYIHRCEEDILIFLEVGPRIAADYQVEQATVKAGRSYRK